MVDKKIKTDKMCARYYVINTKERRDEIKMTFKGSKIKKQNSKKSHTGITLIALVITTIFSYDENIKSSNNKGFLLQSI